MSNQTEKFRIDSEGGIQGGWIFFDWSDGTMRAEWDDGRTEHWSRRGCDIETHARSFLMFTNQFERLPLMEA